MACFVSVFTVVSFSEDFEDLLTFQQIADSEISKSRLLDTDLDQIHISWGFSKNGAGQGDSCQFETEVADGFCDDKANIEECEYDGGDCCRIGSELKPNSHLFCSNCSCHQGTPSIDRVLKPGKFDAKLKNDSKAPFSMSF